MENIQTTETQKRQKTGGRQKGTPNKVTASMKLFIKNFLLDPQITEAYYNAFLSAKPEAIIAHYQKMVGYICGRQSDKENGGEWLPDDNMDLEWPTVFERRQEAINEKIQVREEALHDKKLETAQMAHDMDYFRMKYYEAGAQTKEILTNNEFIQQLIKRYGEENFLKSINELDHQLIRKALQLQGIEPPKPITIAGHTVYTSNNPESPDSSAPSGESPASLSPNPKPAIEAIPAVEAIEETTDSVPTSENCTSTGNVDAPVRSNNVFTPLENNHPDSAPSASSELSALSDSAEESEKSDEPPAPSQPSPSTCRDVGMPRLPKRMANKVQTSKFKLQSKQPFYLGALKHRRR